EGGKLVAWGRNEAGLLGIGNNDEQMIPVEVNGFEGQKIVSIACGAHHSVVSTGFPFSKQKQQEFLIFLFEENGDLFAWGFNGYGQLGIGNTENQLTPCVV